MKKIVYTALFLICVSLNACGQTVDLNKPQDPIESEQKTNIPDPVGYVNDFEGIFSDEEEAVLDSLMKDFEAKTAIEVAVVTLDSSMISKADFDQFTIKLANEWGVGKKDKDNGIVIAISVALRSVRIQNGLGIEKILTNADSQKLIGTVFIPNFRNGHYFEGTKQGILGIIDKLTPNKTK